MDATEVDRESTRAEPVAPAKPSPLGPAWRGAKAGARGMLWLAVPVVVLHLVVWLAKVEPWSGIERGVWPFLGLLIGCGLEATAGLAGGIVGVVAAPFRRARGPVARSRGLRGSRWAWGFAGVLVAILVGVMVGSLVARRRVAPRLAAAMAEAERDDPAWRFDDLMAARRRVPDAENSAIVVSRAVAMLPKGWPSATTIPGEIGELCTRIDATGPDTRLDDETAAAMGAELGLRDDAVKLARTVANDRLGWHELNPPPTLLDMTPGAIQATRTAARLLAADAAIRSEDGDHDGAIASCRAILGVGRSIGDQPFLIPSLIRSAIGGVATDAARRALGQGEPTDAPLAALQADLVEERNQPLLVRSLRGERAVLDELIRRLGDGEVPLSAFGGDEPSTTFLLLSKGPWSRAWFDHQRAVGLEWMNWQITIAHQPPAEQPALLDLLDADVRRVRASRIDAALAALPVNLLPPVGGSMAALARRDAMHGATIILLAAERHRLEHGDWPASIALIDPAILVNPPLDPFSAQPFVIERRDGQFLVYSVGPNLQDEHGESHLPQAGPGLPDDVGTGAWDVPLRGKPAVDAP